MIKGLSIESLSRSIAGLVSLTVLVAGLGIAGCSDDDDDDGDLNGNGQSQTIADIVEADTSFSILETALEATGLDSTLNIAGPFTVFAPTNSAFANLPAGTLDALLANAETDLRPILLYHVASGSLLATDVVARTAIGTVQGDSIRVTVENGNVMLNSNVQVVQTDIMASNGVIHVINGVLLPPAAAQ